MLVRILRGIVVADAVLVIVLLFAPGRPEANAHPRLRCERMGDDPDLWY